MKLAIAWGLVWGFDDEGELRGMWASDRAAGALVPCRWLAQCRIFLEGARVADRGAGVGHHCMIKRLRIICSTVDGGLLACYYMGVPPALPGGQ